MPAPRHNANGHRRRELTARVKAEETVCALCDQPVDKTLNYTPNKHGPRCPENTPTPQRQNNTPPCQGCVPHPMRAEVDEDIPRSRGGSPLERNNTHLMHRRCNQFKSAQTLQEARHRLHNGSGKLTAQAMLIKPSPIW